MTKKQSYVLGLFFITFSLISCNSYKYGSGGEAKSSSNLTFGVVKSKIKKETTTQNEILKLFGSPNIITKNKNNMEVWSYSKMSVVKKGGHTSFLAGERASTSSSTKSFDLIITFNKKDIVKDYSVVSTKF